MQLIAVEEFLDRAFDVPDSEDHEDIVLSRRKSSGGMIYSHSFDDDSKNLSDMFDGKSRLPTYAYTATYDPTTTRGDDDYMFISRGKGAVKRRVHVIYLDDIGTAQGKSVCLPGDVPVDADWRTETSPKNFQFGYRIEPTIEFALVAAFVKRLGEDGKTDKGAAGDSRAFRLPGSINAKHKDEKGQPWRARTEWWAEEDEPRWDLQGLIEAFGYDISELPLQGTRNISASDVAARTADANKRMPDGSNILEPCGDGLLDWMRQKGMVIEESATNWTSVRCPWQEQHGVANHKGGADYSPLGRGDIAAFTTRRIFKCLHGHSGAEHEEEKGPKDSAEFLKWCLENGAPAELCEMHDPVAYLSSRYVYIKNDKQYADLEQRSNLPLMWIRDAEVFKLEYDLDPAFRVKSIADPKRSVGVTSALTVGSSPMTKVNSIMWRPDLPDQLVIPHGKGTSVLNTYVGPDWPDKGDKPPARYFELMDLVWGEHVDVFHDVIAFKLQNPGERPFAMVHLATGDQGVGRSFIKQTMMRMLGTSAVGGVTFDELTSDGFSNWWVGRTFVFCEEVKEGNRDAFWNGYQCLKQNIDNRAIFALANPKYGKMRDELKAYTAFIFSNHKDAMRIDNEDRRMCVVEYAGKRLPDEFYAALEADMKPESALAALYWWYMKRDVSNFNHVRAPYTKAKETMTALGKSSLDEGLEDVQALLLEVHDLIVADKAMIKMMAQRVLWPGAVGTPPHPQEVDKLTNFVWRHMERGDTNARVRIKGVQERVRYFKCDNMTGAYALDMQREQLRLLMESSGLV